MSNAFHELSNAMADAVSTIAPSLVRVEARRRQAATGIVWSADTIVTAHHVIEQEDAITIGLHDGTTVTAKLVGRDPQNDLAVLKVEGGNMTPATWGEALRVGNLVLGVGFPNGRVQASLGAVVAVVSTNKPQNGDKRKRVSRRMGQALADGYLLTNITMYPGFSGGALLGGDGVVYGLNTSGFRADASVSVPVSTIKNTVATLLAHGKMKKGYLGVGVQPVRLQSSLAEELAQETALLITSVEAGSPAEQAKLLIGDILFSVDNERVETVDDLLFTLSGALIGKTVTIEVARGGTLTSVPVTIGEKD